MFPGDAAIWGAYEAMAEYRLRFNTEGTVFYLQRLLADQSVWEPYTLSLLEAMVGTEWKLG